MTIRKTAALRTFEVLDPKGKMFSIRPVAITSTPTYEPVVEGIPAAGMRCLGWHLVLGIPAADKGLRRFLPFYLKAIRKAWPVAADIPRFTIHERIMSPDGTLDYFLYTDAIPHLERLDRQSRTVYLSFRAPKRIVVA